MIQTYKDEANRLLKDAKILGTIHDYEMVEVGVGLTLSARREAMKGTQRAQARAARRTDALAGLSDEDSIILATKDVEGILAEIKKKAGIP